MQQMDEQGVPLSVEKLYELLGIHEEEREIFNRRLNAMEREGQIIRNRKGAMQPGSAKRLDSLRSLAPLRLRGKFKKP